MLNISRVELKEFSRPIQVGLLIIRLRKFQNIISWPPSPRECSFGLELLSWKLSVSFFLARLTCDSSSTHKASTSKKMFIASYEQMQKIDLSCCEEDRWCYLGPLLKYSSGTLIHLIWLLLKYIHNHGDGITHI